MHRRTQSVGPGLVERLKGNPSVKLHADVPDVRPFLASSRHFMAVPLRIGGGSRLKILGGSGLWVTCN